jgi:hypothetical protein
METNWYKDSSYDCYGNLISKTKENFKVGDVVEFSYAKLIKKDGRTKNVIIRLEGLWDGEKVCFSDKEETVVRTTEWLKLVQILTIDEIFTHPIQFHK